MRSGPSAIAEAALDPARSLTTIDALDELAHHVGGTFVIVVEATGGKYRRRCFLSELKPLWKLRGDDA